MDCTSAVTRRLASLFVFLLLAVSLVVAQKPQPRPSPSQPKPAPSPSEPNPFAEIMEKYPDLLPAMGQFGEKLQHDVEFPPDRSQSNLQPLLPPGTNFYLALPNYGDVAHQALTAFRAQLKDSVPLREWWTRGDMLKTGPKIEDALDKFSELSSYLGDEVVISAAAEDKDPHLLIVAEAKKPGLHELLPQILKQIEAREKPHIRVMDVKELAALDRPSKDELLVLVRPDFVVGASDLSTLRSFNDRLDHHATEFASTAFGQRITQSYHGGASTVGAIDLHNLFSLIPPKDAPGLKVFHQTGFDQAQYLTWEHHKLGSRTLSQAELSFTGPRRGIAAWLAPPTTLDSLEFVSPKALFVLSVALNDPAQIFDDIRKLQGNDPKSAASLAQMEQGLGISLKDDLLSQLTGELTLEVDSFTPPSPSGRLILKVKDPARFEKTLNALLFAAHLHAQPFDINGVPLNVIRIPNPRGSMEIGFTFSNGYLIIGVNPDAIENAVELRNSGASLAKSAKFQSALPPGHSAELSALLYQDPVAMAALQMQRFAPNLVGALSQSTGRGDPAVVAVYGNPTSIQEASTNGAYDASAALVVAAIAIPNLLRSRIAANEASAVGSLRTINTAQVTYSATYPDRGFAADLATLGSDPKHPTENSDSYAGLLDNSLANPGCAAGKWCEKSGYRFTTKAICGLGTCNDYVAIATPVSMQTGSRSFCSTSDGIIRFRVGPPLTALLTLRECKAWTPIH